MTKHYFAKNIFYCLGYVNLTQLSVSHRNALWQFVSILTDEPNSIEVCGSFSGSCSHHLRSTSCWCIMLMPSSMIKSTGTLPVSTTWLYSRKKCSAKHLKFVPPAQAVPPLQCRHRWAPPNPHQHPYTHSLCYTSIEIPWFGTLALTVVCSALV